MLSQGLRPGLRFFRASGAARGEKFGLEALLKDTGFQGIYFDVAVLLGFSVLLINASILLFKRQIWPFGRVYR